MSYTAERRDATIERFSELQSHLAKASEIVGNNACVYATGSFGRLEAGQQSDLDVFIVSKTAEIHRDGKNLMVNQLSNLDTILVKAELIKAIKALNMPKFDADGKYLESHSIYDLRARFKSSSLIAMPCQPPHENADMCDKGPCC